MVLHAKTIQIANRLLYPIMFEANPLDLVDWEIEEVIPDLLSFASKSEILDALDEMSQTSGWVDQIASNRKHSEEMIKQFLSSLRSRLHQ